MSNIYSGHAGVERFMTQKGGSIGEARCRIPLTIKLPYELLERLQYFALAQGRTKTSVIEEALEGLIGKRTPLLHPVQEVSDNE